MAENLRVEDVISGAYSGIRESKFYVGYIGAMVIVSGMIALRLILGLVGIYNKRMTNAVATVELFLLIGLVGELFLIFREAMKVRIPLVLAIKHKPFFLDLITVGVGLAFLFAHFVGKTLVAVPFILNLVWIGLVTARSFFYFRVVWEKARSAAAAETQNGPVPIILVGGKPVITGNNMNKV